MKIRAGISCLSVLAALAIAAPAMANEDNGSSADWNGFSFSVGIGTGNLIHNLEEDHTNHGKIRKFSFANFNNFDEVADGLFGTFGLGYDRQVAERFVLGVFTDFDISSMGSKRSFTPNFMDERDAFAICCITTNESTSLEHKYSWNIGGRFGYLVRPSTMIYGLVGYTRGKFHQNFGFNGSAVNGALSAAVAETNSSRDLTFHGITLGAGIERKLADNLFIRGEYRYTNFGKESTSNRSDTLHRGLNAYTVAAAGETFDPSMHTGRISLVVKFNGDE